MPNSLNGASITGLKITPRRAQTTPDSFADLTPGPQILDDGFLFGQPQHLTAQVDVFEVGELLAVASDASDEILPEGTLPGPEGIDPVPFASGSVDDPVAAPTAHKGTLEAGVQITRGGYHWGSGSLGTAVTVSFGFRTSAPGYSVSGHGDVQTTFTAFSAAEKAAARAALDLWSSVANIRFVDQGDTNNATIEFGNYRANDGAQAFAFYPSSGVQGGDVFMNLYYASTTNLNPGTYDFLTLVHEIGHAIGLQHPGDYNAGSGGTITYNNSAQYVEDTRMYTAMSYFSASFTGGSHSVEASSPLLHDIAAVQRLYGANTTTRNGDSVYGFNSNAGSPFAITSASQHVVYTVYDTGGTDTLDFSGYAQNQTIDLRAEYFSSVGGDKYNVSIARGTVIENATGGSGNDLLVGNDTGNVLRGGAGNDVLFGYGGVDTLDGGDGVDQARVGGLKGAGYDIIRSGTAIYTLDRAGHSYDVNYNIESFASLSGAKAIAASSIGEFSVANYIASYNDLAFAFRTNGGAAFSHYLTNGFFERRDIDFDGSQYLRNYADLRAAFGNDAYSASIHFITGGVDEHRLAEDPLDYIASFTDLITAFHGQSAAALAAAGISHYQAGGFAEGRRGGIDFDPAQYLANYADLRNAFGGDADAATAHFINGGYFEHRLELDPYAYVASYGDLTAAFRGRDAEGIRSAALSHYSASGFAEGRHDGVRFDAEQYLANYVDLRDAFQRTDGTYDESAAELHFIVRGSLEGRTDAVL